MVYYVQGSVVNGTAAHSASRQPSPALTDKLFWTRGSAISYVTITLVNHTRPQPSRSAWCRGLWL